MNLDLTLDEARFLSAQLKLQLEHLGIELVHTDDRRLRAALTRDVDELQTLSDRVSRLAAV